MLMRKGGRVQHSPPRQTPIIAHFKELSFNNPPISSQGPQSPLYSNPGTQVGQKRIEVKQDGWEQPPEAYLDIIRTDVHNDEIQS